MDVPQNVDLELSAALEQWTDQRLIDADDLYDLLALMVHHHLVFVNSGHSLTGFSFRQKADSWLLTVKVKESGTPLVVFVTADNPTGCVRRFFNLYCNDRLSWVRDKYA
jgi:hypothetical protein